MNEIILYYQTIIICSKKNNYSKNITFSFSIMSILTILQTHINFSFKFTKHSPIVFSTHNTLKKLVYQTLCCFVLQPLIVTTQQKPNSLKSPALPNWALFNPRM